MKKSLIALAVAGVVAAPAAFAATANVDVYGVVSISLEDTNASNVDMQVTDRQSRIGFKGTEDLGGGLKAVWQVEQAISANAGGQDGVGGATLANRNSFIGMGGGFGTVLMGRHDTPYKLTTAGKLDIFADTMADVNGAGNLNNATAPRDATKSAAVQLVSAAHDIRASNAIAYISPNFSGVTVAAALVAGNADLGVNSTDAYSLSATYENGPIYGALGYQSLKAVAVGTDDNDAWKLGVGYKFGDAKVGFVYENVDPTGTATDRKSWVMNGVYTMGPIALKAQYGQVNNKIAADQSKFSLGADYNLSKRTTAFLVWDKNDTDTAGVSDLNGWALGMKHAF